jgi:hypothetical protein
VKAKDGHIIKNFILNTASLTSINNLLCSSNEALRTTELSLCANVKGGLCTQSRINYIIQM